MENNEDKQIDLKVVENKLMKIAALDFNLEERKVEEKMSVNCSENIKISFSSKYMMDALRTVESKDVVLCFNNDVQPIIIKDSKDDTLLQLILPIKTY